MQARKGMPDNSQRLYVCHSAALLHKKQARGRELGLSFSTLIGCSGPVRDRCCWQNSSLAYHAGKKKNKKTKYFTTQQTKHVFLELGSSQVHCLPRVYSVQCRVTSQISPSGISSVLYVRRVMVPSSLASSSFFIPKQGLTTSSSVISHLEVCGLLAGGICIMPLLTNEKVELGERQQPQKRHWCQKKQALNRLLFEYQHR